MELTGHRVGELRAGEIDVRPVTVSVVGHEALPRDDQSFAHAVRDLVDTAARQRVAAARRERDAAHDELTGLPNRRFLEDLVQRSLRRRGSDTALVFVDLGDRVVLEVTGSVGAAAAVAGDDTRALLSRADAAKYEAKSLRASTRDGGRHPVRAALPSSPATAAEQ